MMSDLKVSIIIPFYNHWDLTHNRLYELYRHAPEYCEIILINDASTEMDCEGGVAWWQKVQTMLNPVRYKKNKENLGFGGSMNVGAQYAKGDILVFLSNDVTISGNFFDLIVTILRNNPTALIGGQVVDWAAGWNEFDFDGHHIVIPYANGWLLAVNKNIWKEIGGFDPRYGKFDFEDVDLSTWFFIRGYDIISLNSDYVKHEHQGATISTLGVDRLAITKRNREIYINKWRLQLSAFAKVENTGNGEQG